MLIDTHAHLNFNAFRDDNDEVIKRALASQVFLINVGSQYSTSVKAVELAEKYKTGVWAAVGLHPIQLQKRVFQYQDDYELAEEEIRTNGEDFEYEKYKELTQNKKVAAIGEVGLDYHHFDPSRLAETARRPAPTGQGGREAGEGDNKRKLIEKQKEVFLKAIKLANEIKKPIIIHCWDAYPDLLEILQNHPIEKRGVVHSFIGGHKTAQKFIEFGYKIGLNGIITYSESSDRLIKEVALENILLETDCPYLAPVPKKGERNEPLYVRYVAQKIAEIKSISIEKVAEITTQNAKELFNLK